MKPTQKKTWKIIFLIYSERIGESPTAGDQPTYRIRDEIAKIKYNDNYNVFVVENKVSDEGQTRTDQTDVSLLKPASGDIKKRPSQDMEIIKSFNNERVLQDGKKLATVFQFIEDEYKSDKTILVTWDHGSAFGMFIEEGEDNEKSARRKKFIYEKLEVVDLSDNLVDAPERGGFKSVKNKPLYNHPKKKENPKKVDEKSKKADKKTIIIDILTNDELGKAIADGFGKKVDVLIMLNCAMQNMHTCYALKDHVNYLVAPEGGIVEPGYDYVTIAEKLANEPFIDPSKIAYLTVDSMRAHYKKWNWLKLFETQSVFALDLNKYTDFMKIFNRQVDIIIQVLKTVNVNNRNLIKTVFSECYDYCYLKRYSILDITSWLRYLDTKKIDKAFLEMAKVIEQEYTNMIVKSAIGQTPYSAGDGQNKKWEVEAGIKPQGAAVHIAPGLPDRAYDIDKYFILPNAIYPSSFLVDTKWLQFFSDLYQQRL